MDMIYTDINNKSVMKVKVFNRIQKEKYYKDIKEWDSKKGGFPFLPMYLFTKDDGMPRKKGYVVSTGNSHKFYLTKEEVFTKENMRIHL